MKARIKRIADRKNPASQLLLFQTGATLRCRHAKPLPAAVFRHAVEPQYDNPSSDSARPLGDLGTVADDLQNDAMEVIQEQFSPQVAIEIDRRCDLVMGRQRKARMAVRQWFETVVALGKLKIGAVDLDMRLNLGRYGPGPKRKSHARSRFSSHCVTIS